MARRRMHALKMRKEAGFGVVELLLIIVGASVASGLPSFLRGQTEKREASAMESLRTINEAQEQYAAKCGGGFYAPSLADLPRPPVGGGDAFIGTDLMTDPSTKDTYSIALTAGDVAPDAPASCNGLAPGTVVSTYFVGASPTGGREGFFGTNQDGTIYRSTGGVPVTQSGAPAGAVPVR